MDAARRREIRSIMADELIAETAELPVSAVGRLGRLGAVTARRGARALVRNIRRQVSPGAELAAARKTAAALGRLKGVPMKIGQLLGYADVSRPAPAAAALSVLESWGQPLPFPLIRAIVARELGEAGDPVLESLEPRPLAVASIGQVHASRLPDGTPVAVKVRYPGIEQTVERDLRPAAIGARITTWLDRASRRDVFVREARARLLEECDYLHEAERHRELARRFAGHPTLWIPEVYTDFSSRSVLTTRRVDGDHLDDFLAAAPDQATRDRAGTALFDFYYGGLFSHGIYNCDPHPGNYLFCPDGRVAVLDHGCTRAFEPGFVANLAALTRAVDENDRQAIHDALVALGIVAPNQDYDHRRAYRILRWFYAPMLRDGDTAFEPADADVSALTADRDLRGIAIPGEFLFLARMRVGIAAVLARLGARTSWRRLQREYLEDAGRQLAASAPFAEPTRHDVVLVETGPSIIELIREVRDLLGIRVREAKELVETAPSVLASNVSSRQAADLQTRFEAAGGIIELRPTS